MEKFLQENLLSLVLVAVGLVLAVVSLIMRKKAAKKLAAIESPTKADKKGKRNWTILSIVGSWLTLCEGLALLLGKPEGGLEVEIFAKRTTIPFTSIEISSTVLTTWCIMAVLIVLALLARIFVIPKMKDEPKGVQNFLELIVEKLTEFIDSSLEDMNEGFGAYIFTLAVYMIGCAFVEMLGVRAPTSDITITFAMALITFFLINFYGIKKKGIGGRIKSYAKPTPIVFPFKIISDIAVPVSLACRLFGNMLGGMIVMELLYMALGSFSVGIPSIAGLYFNVFHPLIQAYIFITLTLTFIGEAVE